MIHLMIFFTIHFTPTNVVLHEPSLNDIFRQEIIELHKELPDTIPIYLPGQDPAPQIVAEGGVEPPEPGF